MSASIDRRRRRLASALGDASVEALIVTHLPNVRYLTGFSGSSGTVLATETGSPVLITDFRYEEQAREEVGSPIRVEIAGDGWIAAAAAILTESGVEAIGVEAEHLSVAEHARLADKLPDADWVETRLVIERLRAVKDEGEVESIERAAGIAETALERLLASTDWSGEPTERDLAAALAWELTRAGSERQPFEAIVASGARTSLPHASPTDRPVARGDLLLVDFGATADGYCCDITRTFSVGPAESWQRELHGRVLESQRQAIERLGPGVEGAAVDRAVREALSESDLARHFGHSTGHGIGLAVHEDPRLSSRSDDVLAPGNVVTVEPGVYLPGRGGVRIEDDVLVTEAGSRTLTRFPRGLLEL